MSKRIIMDQLRLTMLVPRKLPRRVARQIDRFITRARFRRELARCIQSFFRQYRELDKVKVQLSP